MKQSGGIFGCAEFFRRLPWTFSAIFLALFVKKSTSPFFLLRIGVSFAFIAHGMASVGFYGLKGGHVELASQILSEDAATTFVFYSGISDSILGLLLMSGILSKWAAIIGSVWLLFIVFLSFSVGFPDGIFRTGFFLMCLYVAFDKRCHQWKYEN